MTTKVWRSETLGGPERGARRPAITGSPRHVRSCGLALAAGLHLRSKTLGWTMAAEPPASTRCAGSAWSTQSPLGRRQPHRARRKARPKEAQHG